MPLRFRSFVPYTLPGVLALIGWWWYISRKKERITSHDSEEGSVMGLRTSSGEGSNGMVDKSCPAASSTHHRTSRDRVNAKEHRPVEQEVVAEIHTVLKATAGEVLSTPPVVLASGQLSAPQSGTKSVPPQSHPETTTPVSSSTPTKTVEESTHHKGPEASIGNKPLSQLPSDLASTGSIKKQVENQPLTKQRPAELAKAERPEPEGEVAAETSAPTCTQNLPVDLLKAELPSATSSTESEGVLLETCNLKTPLTLTSFPNSTSTPLSESSTEAQHHENGDLGLLAKTSPDMQELQRLAAGLITEVISAATQEVMAVSSCESRYSKGSEASDSSTPAVNGKKVESCVPPESVESAESRAVQIAEDVINGCLAPLLWKMPENEKERGSLTVPSGEQLESTPVLAKLQAEESLVEDSGCSTGQSEDGISSEELHSTGLSSNVSENKEDLIQISGTCRASEGQRDGLQECLALIAPQESPLTAENVATVCEAARLNGTGFRNGAASEVEADQSGGELQLMRI